MAFGSSPGYPASHHQMQRLTKLLEAAGFADFREARGQLGLTQRQAGGKFTGPEADGLIERLEADAEAGTGAAEHEPVSTRAGTPRVDQKAAKRATLLREMPAELLAGELQRRGWIVVEP